MKKTCSITCFNNALELMSVWERMFLDITWSTDAAVPMCKFPIPQTQMQPGCQTCWHLTC